MLSLYVIGALVLVLLGVKMIVTKALKMMGFAVLLLGLLVAGGAFAFFSKGH